MCDDDDDLQERLRLQCQLIKSNTHERVESRYGIKHQLGEVQETTVVVKTLPIFKTLAHSNNDEIFVNQR